MKVFYDVEKDNEVIIHMTKAEARKFDEFLHTGLYPKENKPLQKSAKGWKIAKNISELMCIW